MSLATSDEAVLGTTESVPGGWHQGLAVLLIEQGRELCNVMTELPAPVGDGLAHSHDPICPQDPGAVHAARPLGELVWLLEAIVVLVEDLSLTSVDLAGEQLVAGLGPVVAIASRWAAAARSLLLVVGPGPGSSAGIVVAA